MGSFKPDNWNAMMGGSGIGQSPFLIPASVEGMNDAQIEAMMNHIGIHPAAQQQMLASTQQQLAQQAAMAQANAMAQAEESKQVKLAKQNNRARDMLLMRMGGVDGVAHVSHADFVHCQCYGDKVYLFYLFSGKEGVVTEDINIFPSDTLVAQMRLIVNA